MLGSTTLPENPLSPAAAVPAGFDDRALPGGSAPRAGSSFAHQLSSARAAAALDEQDPRRRTRSDLAALAVQELSSRQDSSPSAAVTTAESALAQDRAGQSSPQFTAQPRPASPPSAHPQSAAQPTVTAPRTGASSTASASVAAGSGPSHAGGSAAESPTQNVSLQPAPPIPPENAAVSAVAAPATVAAPQAATAPAPSGTPAAAPISKSTDARPHTAAIRRPAPPPRPFQLEESSFTQQVSRAMAAALRQRGGTVTMRLAPDALGQVRVALTLDAGRVDATFEASTDQARRLLNDNMTALRAALEAHGLTVDRLGVAPTEGPAHHDPGTGSLSPDSGGARNHSQSASEHAGNHAQARGTDARGLTQGDDPAEPTRQGPALTGGARTIRLRLDAVA